MSCKYFHCTGNITVSTTNVVIDFPSPVTANNEDRFCFRLCSGFSGGETLPVQVTVNGTAIPLLDRYGNPVLGAELKTRVNYRGFYGSSTPHVIIHNLPHIERCTCVL